MTTAIGWRGRAWLIAGLGTAVLLIALVAVLLPGVASAQSSSPPSCEPWVPVPEGHMCYPLATDEDELGRYVVVSTNEYRTTHRLEDQERLVAKGSEWVWDWFDSGYQDVSYCQVFMVEVTTRIGRQTITSWRPPTETSGPVMLQTERTTSGMTTSTVRAR
jgi:hypothetical protein